MKERRVYSPHRPLGAFQMIDPDQAVFITVLGAVIVGLVWA